LELLGGLPQWSRHGEAIQSIEGVELLPGSGSLEALKYLEEYRTSELQKRLRVHLEELEQR